MCKKTQLLLFLLVIMIPLCSCGKSKPTLLEIDHFDFPLREDDFRIVLSKLDLGFSLTNMDKDQLFARISQENPYFDGLTIASSNSSDQSIRHMQTTWRFRDADKEILMKDHIAEIKKIIQLTCILYGKTEIIDTLYGFIDSYKESEYDTHFMWATKLNDTHVYLSIKYASMDDPNRWCLRSSIWISNEEAYEQGYISYINNLKTLPNISIVNTDQLKALACDGEVTRFILNGYLTNIRFIESKNDMIHQGFAPYVNDEGYQSATLNDDLGSIEVYIEPNTFNEKELSVKKDYQIRKYGDGQNSCFVIRDIYN